MGHALGIAADFLHVVAKVPVKSLEAELGEMPQSVKVLPGFAEHVETAGTHSGISTYIAADCPDGVSQVP